MKAVLVIDMPNNCGECKLIHLQGIGESICDAVDWSKRPSWCPLKPLNKIVKAGDRNLIIYERAWLYSHLEEEFEMQKKVRDWEKQNETNC